MAYWKSFDRRREQYYGTVTNQVQKRFRAEYTAVKAALRTKGEAAALEAVDAGRAAWAKMLKAVHVMVAEDFGKQTFNSLKTDAMVIAREKKDAAFISVLFSGIEQKEFDVFDSAIQAWIAENVAEKVRMISDYTKELIRKHIAEGVAAGESIDKIAKRIDGLYLDQIIPNRSVTIARTEVIGASNAASRFSALQTGLDLEKEWLSTADKRTRETHRAANGQVRAMDEPYNVGGSSMMFPGDPKGGAREVIKCRCTETYQMRQ